MRFDDPRERIRSQMSLDLRGTDVMDVWFGGPRFENEALFRELMSIAVEKHAEFRRDTYPEDPPWVDRSHPGYRHAAGELRSHLRRLIDRLSTSSTPWYSYRYQGHMNWDSTLPSLAGYIAAVFFNQNNVAAEASSVTTELELEVGRDLCRMLGYAPDGADGRPEPWGHITCGGTVANIEALWAARNVKLYPFAVQQALIHDLRDHRDFEVEGADGRSRPLAGMGVWEVLNIPAPAALGLVDRLRADEGLGDPEMATIAGYTVQRLGLGGLARRFEEMHGTREPLDRLGFLAPATAHYSMPKAATLLGLGSDNLVVVPVDERARMSVDGLRSILEERLAARLPVAAVVAVMGSTQEGAVDPLADILALRDELRAKGMDFQVHADGAWGGYFASLLREPHPDSASARLLADAEDTLAGEALLSNASGFDAGPAPSAVRLALAQMRVGGTADAVPAERLYNAGIEDRMSEEPDSVSETEETDEAAALSPTPPPLPGVRPVFTAELALNAHVTRHLERLGDADTITVDPHKGGLVPYPAGALCYRDRRMPEMIAYKAPVVYHDGAVPTVGVYGVEGSKPGAAPAAVWLSHRVIRPDQSGYGHILGRCAFGATRLFCALVSMDSPLFVLRTLQELDDDDVRRLRELNELDNRGFWEALLDDPSVDALLDRVAPDLLINTFVVNPLDDDGVPNADPAVANALNEAVFQRLSVESPGAAQPPLILTGSEYDPAVIGQPFVDRFRARLGIRTGSDLPLRFLISTTANPWLTDADNGRRNMVPTIAGLLRDAIEEAARALPAPSRT